MSALRQLQAAFIFIAALHVQSPSFAGNASMARTLAKAVEACERLLPRDPAEYWLPTIAETGDAICFRGIIDRSTDERLIKTFERTANKILIIDSPWGDIPPAVSMALYMKEHGINIGVYGACLSACANIIFLGAKYKYVADDTLIAWHPQLNAQTLLYKHKQDVIRDQLGYAAEAELELGRYSKAIPSASALGVPLPESLKANPEWEKKFSEQTSQHPSVFARSAWSYSPEILRSRFEIEDIVYMWYPRTPSDVETMKQKASKLGIDNIAFE